MKTTSPSVVGSIDAATYHADRRVVRGLLCAMAFGGFPLTVVVAYLAHATDRDSGQPVVTTSITVVDEAGRRIAYVGGLDTAGRHVGLLLYDKHGRPRLASILTLAGVPQLECYGVDGHRAVFVGLDVEGRPNLRVSNEFEGKVAIAYLANTSHGTGVFVGDEADGAVAGLFRGLDGKIHAVPAR
ncbi:MAG: hypothetical protein IT204_09975 [Fimbriimonadaceae bacterium]|nr:hypothetical protein [Fimbriimonadaceae bacterium]